MNDYHILDFDYKKDPRIEEIFKKIASKNTILFLGAGASVGENRFLSKDLIDFYEDKKGISWDISNITDFVDTLINTPGYSRDEFDNYVDECLRMYKVTAAHKILARLNWRDIITTNYDLLIENSFKEIEGTSHENLKLRAIRSRADISYYPSNDEVRYIKLNGCISDKRKYKMVFSTEDFKAANAFYKPILTSLKSLSDNILFLSIGYSFSDDLAKKIIDKFESYDYRDKKIIYSVDPYVNDSLLPLFKSKNICIVRCSMQQFFEQYEEWEKENLEFQFKQQRAKYLNKENKKIIIPHHISVRLNGSLIQIDPNNYRSIFISDKQYYEGEEPNYNVIIKHYDVIKRNKLNEVLSQINNNLFDQTTRIIPTIFFTGSFGTGKSTFAYRILDELNKDHDTICFEILDPTNIKAVDLNELFLNTKAKKIILYINSIELDSVFKSFMELRHHLSLVQPVEYSVLFIATIRENILEKFKSAREIKNNHSIKVDCRMNETEVSELLDKLKNSGLVNFRDITEKELLIRKIIRDYDGDSYISLLEIVSNNKHLYDLQQAYHNLGTIAKKAFLYTSVLYQFKIPMPVGLLKSLVANDWQEFRDNVINIEGKGILIQEEKVSTSTAPDIYFKTRHPLISKYLIDSILKDEDKKYQYYETVVKHIILDPKSPDLLIDFLKSLQQYEVTTNIQLNKLFDLADNNLGENAKFLLHYAINLQHRKTEESLKKAIEKIIYAESISTYRNRNHYLIHRRGVVTFELAKLIFNDSTRHSERYKVYSLIEEARDLLDIKKRLDPCSSFSYRDAVILELWCLENLDYSQEEILKVRIKIEELFDTASRAVYENLEKIYEVKNRYVSKYKFVDSNTEYLDYLENYYNSNTTSRPYALILLFNYYFERKVYHQCYEYSKELQHLTHIKEVLRTLFKFYGMMLHIPNYRMRFFDLIKGHPELEEMDELRYYYYVYIAESYNNNFEHALDNIKSIHDEFNHINPDFKRDWLDPESSDSKIFEGYIKIGKRGKKYIYINDLGRGFPITNNKNSLIPNERYRCTLCFYLFGIGANVLQQLSDKNYNDSQESDESFDDEEIIDYDNPSPTEP